MNIDYASQSVIGQRKDNQDRVAIAIGDEAALIMVFENTLHFFIAPFGMALTGRLQGSWLKIAGGIVWKVVSF
ncbi:MAG: hypothetical protein AAFU66_09595, partial [Pseudomonadota bacterium]